MITADQIVVHLIGDYIAQSDWMAQNKTKAHLPAFVHALTYSLLFLAFRPSLSAWLVIFMTHFFIDRYRLARYVVWAKNWIGPIAKPVPMDSPDVLSRGLTFPTNVAFRLCSATGYPERTPIWMATWLLIIADNILHIVINGLALKFL